MTHQQLAPGPFWALHLSTEMWFPIPGQPLAVKLLGSGTLTPTLQKNLPGSDLFFVVAFFLILCIYLWLNWVFVCELSLVAAVGATLYVVEHATLIAMASSVVEHGLQDAGLAAVALSRLAAWGIFLDQGSNPLPLLWQADSLPLDHQGSPRLWFTWSKGELWKEGAAFHEVDPGASAESSRKPHHPWGQRDADRRTHFSTVAEFGVYHVWT